MKSSKYIIVMVIAASLLSGCKKQSEEKLPSTFAADVVQEMLLTDINPTIDAGQWATKANLWYENMGNEDVQNEIEDMYFNGKEPRMRGDTLVLLPTFAFNHSIFIITQGASLSDGATWHLLAPASQDYMIDEYEIIKTDENRYDVKRWKEDHSYTLSIIQDEMSGYVILDAGEGETFIEFMNTPIVAQTFEIVEPFISYGDYKNDEILEGEIYIQLKSKNGIIEEDDINVEFARDQSSWGETYMKLFFRGEITYWYPSFSYYTE